MLFTATTRKIRVMFTPFRDGLQSSFGGKVRLKDILPAMEYSARHAGIRHFEFGGGARYQAPYFYAGEDPFACMDGMRQAVGHIYQMGLPSGKPAGYPRPTSCVAHPLSIPGLAS